MSANKRQLIRRGGLVVVLVVAALVVAEVIAPTRSSTYTATGPPRELPTETVAPVTAAEFSGILVGLRGQPVVVNLWASWCAPCRTEMPLLERTAAAYDGRVTLLGLASRDSRSAAAEFVSQVGVTYPTVFDAAGDVRRALGANAFPTTYFFDRDGQLVETVVGGLTEQQITAQVDDLLRRS